MTESKHTLKTVLHTYSYNLSNPEEQKAYADLREKLNDGRHWMNAWSGVGRSGEDVKPGEIELETKFLSSNQWNSTTHRVFDWYEEYTNVRTYRRGHWLEITDEMKDIRLNTLVCGYCGKQYRRGTEPGPFCEACLDSAYLKDTELHLLRLFPVALHMPDRQELSETERSVLFPKYIQRQTVEANSRAVQDKARIRREVEEKYRKEKDAVESEYRGMIWLLDHNVNTNNCIFYDYTGRFCFGWRQPLSPEVKSTLLDVLTEFPFDYDIK